MDSISLKANSVNLKKDSINVEYLDVINGNVRLKSGTSVVDTTSGNAMWTIYAWEIDMRETRFRMTDVNDSLIVDAHLPEGYIEKILVDIPAAAVTVETISLEDGHYIIKTYPSEEPATVLDNPDIADTEQWVVSAEKIDIKNNSFGYSNNSPPKSKGIDFNNLSFSEINADIDSAYYRGQNIGIRINDINFKERSGIKVNTMQLSAAMDSSYLSVNKMVLRTDNSEVTADAQIGTGITGSAPETPVNAKISADIDIDEFLDLFTITDPELEHSLRGKNLKADLNIGGRLNRVLLDKVVINIPGEINLTAEGSVIGLPDAKDLGGDIRFTASLTDGEIIEQFLLDTAARNRINIPPFSTHGTVAASNGTYSPDILLNINGGNLSVSGSYNSNNESYRVIAEANSFPVYSILPKDSLGTTSFTITADGHGFDFFNTNTEATVDFSLDSILYSGYTYRNITLDAELKNNILSGNINSDSEALDVGLEFSGILMYTDQQAEIHGEIKNLDLYILNFSEREMNMSFFLDMTAKASGTRIFDFNAEIDTLRIFDGSRDNYINHTELTVTADTALLNVDMTSGDLALKLSVYESLDSLISHINSISAEIQSQIIANDIDMRTVNNIVPAFDLQTTSGNNNIIGYFLRQANLGFRKMELDASKSMDTSFNVSLKTDYITFNNLLFDTLSVGISTDSGNLDYNVILSNLRSGENSKAHIDVYGSVYSDTVTLTAVHHDMEWKTGFNIESYTVCSDTSAVLRLMDRGLILNYDNWNVNADNYISYGFTNGRLGADLRLNNNDQLLAVESIDNGSIHLEINNLDLGTTMSLIPSAPEMDGRLSANITGGIDPVSADGNISVSNLLYQRDTLGNIDLDLNYNNSSESFDALMNVNGDQVLTANGNLGADSTGNLNINAEINRLPLNLANPFIPDDYADLNGYLNGNLSVTGSSGNTLFSGNASFEDAEVNVALVGTEFDISDNNITIQNSVLSMNGFSIISPNNQSMDINGTVDFSNFSNIVTDLRVTADNFQAVDVQRNRSSVVYGTAFLDMDVTAKGSVNELVIRGEVDLLNNTDVTYVMQNNSLDIEEQAQDIVTFVSFRDTTYYELPDTTVRLKLTGIDMLVNINIEEGVDAAINLSADGQNRIEVKGSGELTYASNQLGDTRFTGRYNLTGGTVNYNPPVISAKSFAIQEGSYVQWNGDIADPTVNITAIESVITNVTEEGQSSARRVDFNIIIRVENSLDNLEITFDLAAPNDLSIQNQLSSLTAEQRSSQAMNLLIYNTYNGPGTVAKGNSTNPLNTFVERELNQWAQDNLKGVDLSFGIDTYNQATSTGQTTRTDYSYRLSKNLFNDRVRTVIGGRISTDSETDDALTDNFIDDISLEYLLNDSGNMYVKVFRHTGYESILEGEVTQTGFGFVVRKKMNKLYELFRFGKKRKQKKLEEQQKEEAAAATNSETTTTEDYADEE